MNNINYKGILNNEELSSHLAELSAAPYKSDFQRWYKLLYACHYITDGKGLPAFLTWCKTELGLTSVLDDARQSWQDVNDGDPSFLKYDARFLAKELAEQGKTRLDTRLKVDEPNKLQSHLRQLVNAIQTREQVGECIDGLAELEAIPPLALYETLCSVKERTEIPLNILRAMYDEAVNVNRSKHPQWASYTTSTKGIVKPKPTYGNLKYFCKSRGISVMINHMTAKIDVRYENEVIDELHLIDLMNEEGLSGYRKVLPSMLRNLSRENEGYHPVKEWLAGKQWDGEDRFPALIEKLNVRRCPPDLIRIYLTRWLLGGIEGIYNKHGVEKQSMLVLHGKPACGKTTFFESLIPEELRNTWFTSNVRQPWNNNENKKSTTSWLTEVGRINELLLFGHIVAGRVRTLYDLSHHLDSALDKPFHGEPTVRRNFFCAGITAYEDRLAFAADRHYFVLPIHDIKFNLQIDTQQLWLQIKQLYDDGQRHTLLKAELNKHYHYARVMSLRPEWITEKKSYARFHK